MNAPSGKTFAEGFETRSVSLGELSWAVVAYQWSPIIWKGGRRRQENFLESHFLALDFDAPEFDLAAATRSFQGLAHLIGTTRSHGKLKGGVTCDRYRVVVPWSEVITSLDVYRHNVALALRLYEHADAACKDGARLYFPCKTIVVLEDEGDAWDVIPTPPAASKQTPDARSIRQHKLSPFAVHSLENVMPEGSRNPACFRLACEFSRLGIDIDDAIARICMSPTYVGVNMALNRRLFAEIEKCVRSGYRAVERERALAATSTR